MEPTNDNFKKTNTSESYILLVKRKGIWKYISRRDNSHHDYWNFSELIHKARRFVAFSSAAVHGENGLGSVFEEYKIEKIETIIRLIEEE